MGKADSDRREGKPKMEIIKPPPPSFFKTRPAAETPSGPKSVQVDGRDLIEKAKANGKGWDARMEELLNVPPTLHKRVTDSATFYSKNGKFEIQDVLLGMPMRNIPGSLTDYGAALYSTGGSVYFAFVDMERRIAVRERVFCIHEDPPEKDWKAVREKLEAAISLSESEASKKPRPIAVYDQMLESVVPS